MGCQASTVAFEKRDVKAQASRIEECYDIKQKLGEGNFAVVRACTGKKSQSALAVKILVAADETKARRELAVWRKVGTHENIVPLVEDFVEGNTFYFVMPRCQCSITDKFKIVKDSTTHNNMLDAFHQVFLGLQHCHSVDVIHRDMKAANLLVDYSGNVRIADFGLSICHVAGGVTGLAGSVPYMSPEMARQLSYGLQTDIWSCGVAAYTMFYGKYPYEAEAYKSTEERKNLILEAIRKNSRAPEYEPVDGKPIPSPSVRAFIMKLLERNAELRPDAFVCSKLIVAAKGLPHFVPESGNASAFGKPTALKEDTAEASWSTACPTDAASSWGSEKRGSYAVRSAQSHMWASEKSECVVRSAQSSAWHTLPSDKWATIKRTSTTGRVILGGTDA